MSLFNRDTKKPVDDEAGSLDPIAVTLAVWLGLVVAVTGLVRLSADAAALGQKSGPAASASVAMQFAS